MQVNAQLDQRLHLYCSTCVGKKIWMLPATYGKREARGALLRRKLPFATFPRFRLTRCCRRTRRCLLLQLPRLLEIVVVREAP
jgi:hypothetical protein